MTNPFLTLSDTIAAQVARAAPLLAAINPHTRAARSGIIWRPGVLVTSEQGLPDSATAQVILPGGQAIEARLAGRDPGTNVAVLRMDVPAAAPDHALPSAAEPRVGTLALALGADAAGQATARLAMVHTVGPAWDSMAGGRVDRLIRLDVQLPTAEEGGPVLDAAGGLLGMTTLGPRRRVLTIPAATVERVLVPLLADGQVARLWLGVRLQLTALPEALREAAGQEAGLMIAALAASGPAEAAGLLPGDILLAMDEHPATHPRALLRALAASSAGQQVSLRLMRGGQVLTVPATVGARP